MKCENCNGIIESNYGSGRFCSSYCARSFSTSKDRTLINSKVSNKLKGKIKKVASEKINYECEKCGDFFCSSPIRNGRKRHCENCRRKTKHFVDINNVASITVLSSRTIMKIIKRSGIKCGLCNWDKASLDLHHIKERSKGGLDADDNLAPICPNCHRMAHSGLYDIEVLKSVALDKVLPNWRKYYYPGDGPTKNK